MKLSLITVSALFLAACQGCRHPSTPISPEPNDAATVVIDAASAPVDAGSLGQVPKSPCWSAILGPAGAFCAQDLPTILAVASEPPSVRGKLSYTITDSTAHGRILVRYANGSASKMKVVVQIENLDTSVGTLILIKKGVAGPTTDSTEGERLASERRDGSQPKPAVTVTLGKPARLDPSLEVGLPTGYFTIGLYDYSFDKLHAVRTCLIGEREDASVCSSL